jgi:hypothetical protein
MYVQSGHESTLTLRQLYYLEHRLDSAQRGTVLNFQ